MEWMIVAGFAACLCLAASEAWVAQVAYQAPPRLEVNPGVRCILGGFVGQRVRANRDEWLLRMPAANPALIAMFRDRDAAEPRDLLPWSGEFVGKYLTAAVLCWRLTRDRELEREIRRVASEFIATQSPEGYLGPFPRAGRLRTGWDLWGHYHALVGLLLCHRESGDPATLQTCRRAADFICATFPEHGLRVSQAAGAGDIEMNQAIAHGMLLLYRETGEPRYLEMAHRVERDWETPPAGDYVRTALAGLPFWQTPKPRWESLHNLMAIAELALVTGDDRYRRAFTHIWWSIVEGDRHNTGGFSSGEQACGNPYSPQAIETCCTVAWAALSLDMLRLTGDSLVADEIEYSTLNAGLGAQCPSGRWWTYNTPMDGQRKASFHDIGFQCRPGLPELNCCSVNGPRLLGMISQWALMQSPDGLALNYYGPCRLQATLPSGVQVIVRQETRYPLEGRVAIRVTPERPTRFILLLRIPAWSEQTAVKVNGRPVSARPGAYLLLARTWREGDRIEMDLDLRPHFWVGEHECAGKASIYRGPLLLAYDPRFNPIPFSGIASLEAASLRLARVRTADEPTPWLLLRVNGEQPRYLCDFASAGATGTVYHSWLPIGGLAPAPFSRENPLRSVRPGDGGR